MTTTEMTVLDPWESYNTKDGRWRVVVLNDARRTTFTIETGWVPNYIVVSEEYHHISFRNTLPDPDPILADLVTIWRVFVE